MRMLAMQGTRPIRSRRTLVALSALIICACSRPEDAPDVAAAAEELGIPSHAVDLATLQPVGTPVNGWGRRADQHRRLGVFDGLRRAREQRAGLRYRARLRHVQRRSRRRC